MSLKMTAIQVVKTSVTVNNNSPIQDYVHPDDQTQPSFEMTPGFKPFTHYKRNKLANIKAKPECSGHVLPVIGNPENRLIQQISTLTF